MSRQTDNNNNPLSLDMIDEDRVRRALGLKSNGSSTPHQQRPEQARQRHRFVAEGAVPVVMLNRTDSETTGLKERLSAAEHALEIERASHAATRRALQEANHANQAMQTRFGHTELSNGEALRTERDLRRAAEEALVAFRAEAEQAMAALKAEIAERKMAEAVAPERVRREIKASEPIPRKTRALSSKEPKPVRWWTPSYRSKQK